MENARNSLYRRAEFCDSAEAALKDRQASAPRPVVVILQAGCISALVILIVGLLRNPAVDQGDHLAVSFRPALFGGHVVRREWLNEPPASPMPIADPDRIKNMLPTGRTHEVLLKGGFVGRVRDPDFGTGRPISLAFAFEVLTKRSIESNDGHRIVVRLEFERVRGVKLLYDVAEPAMDLGPPGISVLGSLDCIRHDPGIVAVPAKAVAEAILAKGAQAVRDDAASRAFLQTGTLSGKTVRIAYVDGIGVQSVEPLACCLAALDRDFLFHWAVLSDAHILPEVKTPAGATWEVDASQLAGFLDPSMRGFPRGAIFLERDKDCQLDGKQYAILRIRDGCVQTMYRSGRAAWFRPNGTLRYNVSDGLLETAHLHGSFSTHIRGDTPGEGHLLFGALGCTTTFNVSYSCKVL